MADISTDVSQVIAELRIGACNLAVLRGVVDKAIEETESRGYAGPIPRGYASDITAALWSHLQSALLQILSSGGAETPEKDAIVVAAYQKAQDNWSAQCFDFTSAPDSMKRTAHEVAREGFNEIVTLLGPLARPVLKAEYDEARKAAEAERAAKVQE